MGRIYSSCGELENWLGELLDCCSFSSYSPAKSLWEGFCREVWVMECVCHGQEHLRTARIAQAEQKSKQCLQHEQEMLVVCRRDSSALCLKWWCAGFQHKLLLCQCLRSRGCRDRDAAPWAPPQSQNSNISGAAVSTSALLQLLLWYQQQDEFSASSQGVAELLCDARGEFLNKNCWIPAHFMSHMCGREGTLRSWGKEAVKSLDLFSNIRYFDPFQRLLWKFLFTRKKSSEFVPVPQGLYDVFGIFLSTIKSAAQKKSLQRKQMFSCCPGGSTMLTRCNTQ